MTLEALDRITLERWSERKTEDERIALELRERFATVNEFRAAMSDRELHFVTKEEYSVNQKAIEQRITDMSLRIDDVRDRVKGIEARSQGIGSIIAWIIGGMGAIAALISALYAIHLMSTH